jgi:predicted TIM-barrel fold metal-dependent hydrolase
MLSRLIVTGVAILMLLSTNLALAVKQPESLSPGARALVEQAFVGLEGRELVDYHVHMLGLGVGGTGASVNPRLLSWAHPISRLKAKIFFKSSGISDEAKADQQYLERLLKLAQGFVQPIKLAILALDYHYTRDGRAVKELSEIFTPSDYVLALAKRYPDAFIPVVSVHPYDPEALQKLETLAKQGARMVKWLPNAQGMDPSDPAIDPYYRLMVRYGMILLCHTGYESAVQSDGAQGLGNPLLLRRPLDLGVTVIMAHAGNRGSSEDIDHPGNQIRNFDLFLRMMDDPKYEDRLFADISAVTQVLRSQNDLKILLKRGDLHHRFVNGSDYPLPAIYSFIQPRLLQFSGFISADERRYLSEIFQYNPLLFDFVLKRTLRHPESGEKFSSLIFAAHPGLAVKSKP